MADANGDGELDRVEFVAAYGMHREAMQFFTAADANKDGQLDRQEFTTSCSSGMLPFNKVEAEAFFDKADMNRDGEA